MANNGDPLNSALVNGTEVDQLQQALRAEQVDQVAVKAISLASKRVDVSGATVGAYWRYYSTPVPPPPEAYADFLLPSGYMLTGDGVYSRAGPDSSEPNSGDDVNMVVGLPCFVAKKSYDGEVRMVYLAGKHWLEEWVPAERALSRSYLVSRYILPARGAKWSDVYDYIQAAIQVAPYDSAEDEELAQVAIALLKSAVPERTTLPYKLPVSVARDALRDVPGVTLDRLRKWLVANGFIDPKTEFLHIASAEKRRTYRVWKVIKMSTGSG